jgi:hypothetical protein
MVSAFSGEAVTAMDGAVTSSRTMLPKRLLSLPKPKLATTEDIMTDESQEQNPLSRNFLGKNFYVVVTTPTAPREKLEPLIPAHLAIRFASRRRASCSRPVH